jgi:uronate dehydrogenase
MGRKKIMITGAAGGIGKVLKVGLKKWYRLRLLYHQNILPAESDEEVCLGSITDLSKMIEVSAGVNAVVHLACRQAGVGRIIYASSNHVTGYYEIERTYTTPEMPVRPDGYYGVSKVFGEALGRYYADAFGISVICIRIGTCRSKIHLTNRNDDRILSTWLSHRDMVQLVRRSIEAEAIRFGIYYGISGNTRAYWDIENARKEIGYTPEDNAETYA